VLVEEPHSKGSSENAASELRLDRGHKPGWEELPMQRAQSVEGGTAWDSQVPVHCP
jgi:hypothetical protein